MYKSNDDPFPSLYFSTGEYDCSGTNFSEVYKKDHYLADEEGSPPNIYKVVREEGIVLSRVFSERTTNLPSLVILTPDGKIARYGRAQGCNPGDNHIWHFPDKEYMESSNELNLSNIVSAIAHLGPRPIQVRYGNAPTGFAMPGEEFCWSCGAVNRAEEMYLAGRCPNPKCQYPSDFDRSTPF